MLKISPKIQSHEMQGGCCYIFIQKTFSQGGEDLYMNNFFNTINGSLYHLHKNSSATVQSQNDMYLARQHRSREIFWFE